MACFEPLIACLATPALFNRLGRVYAFSGLLPMEKVKYGRAFKYNGKFDVQAAHRAEELLVSIHG